MSNRYGEVVDESGLEDCNVRPNIFIDSLSDVEDSGTTWAKIKLLNFNTNVKLGNMLLSKDNRTELKQSYKMDGHLITYDMHADTETISLVSIDPDTLHLVLDYEQQAGLPASVDFDSSAKVPTRAIATAHSEDQRPAIIPRIPLQIFEQSPKTSEQDSKLTSLPTSVPTKY